jgi:D-alanyl-D-alanine carboxypeptidase
MMKKAIYLFLLIISFLFTSCTKKDDPVSPSEKPFSSQTVAALDQGLQEALQEYNAPGIIIGVWSPEGSYVRAVGTSNLMTGEPMRIINHFRMGSVTKLYTGTVTLMLVDSGKINLDSSLTYYLPQYPFPKADKITVRMLGNMVSGIFDYSEHPEYLSNGFATQWSQPFTIDSLVRISLQYPLNFEPGTEWAYSNTNTELLGLICEKVTGKTIRELITNMILTPCGLTNTIWPLNGYLSLPYSHGYTNYIPDGKGLRDATNYNPSYAGAAGSMTTDIYDLKKFLKLLTDGSFYSPAMQAVRLASVPGLSQIYGFNLAKLLDGKIIGHTGGIWGFNTVAYRIPSKDMTIVISSNYFWNDGFPPAEGVLLKVVPIVAPELFAK